MKISQLIAGLGLAVCLATQPALADRADSFYTGLNYYEQSDYASAMRIWRPLAEQGNASAQFFIGVLYDNGEGVPQDYTEAIKWYRMAAEQGHVYAQNNLGFIYKRTEDYSEAAKWFRIAAERGESNAQTNLGTLYEDGNGVPQDKVLAHMWYNLAATDGNKNGIISRDALGATMTADQIFEAQKMAREWMAAHPK